MKSCEFFKAFPPRQKIKLLIFYRGKPLKEKRAETNRIGAARHQDFLK